MGNDRREDNINDLIWIGLALAIDRLQKGQRHACSSEKNSVNPCEILNTARDSGMFAPHPVRLLYSHSCNTAVVPIID